MIEWLSLTEFSASHTNLPQENDNQSQKDFEDLCYMSSEDENCGSDSKPWYLRSEDENCCSERAKGSDRKNLAYWQKDRSGSNLSFPNSRNDQQLDEIFDSDDLNTHTISRLGMVYCNQMSLYLNDRYCHENIVVGSSTFSNLSDQLVESQSNQNASHFVCSIIPLNSIMSSKISQIINKTIEGNSMVSAQPARNQGECHPKSLKNVEPPSILAPVSASRILAYLKRV